MNRVLLCIAAGFCIIGLLFEHFGEYLMRKADSLARIVYKREDKAKERL